MARLTDTILSQNSYAPNIAPMVNPVYGGQNGYDLALTEWVSAAQYVPRNLIPILMEAPKAYDLMPNGNVLKSSLKAILELAPLSIDGLNATLTVDFGTNAVGGAGQQMHDIQNVTEEVSAPAFHWADRYGSAIGKFWRAHITNFMMDPNTKYPAIVTRSGITVTDLLPDMYSFTMLFIEPDPTGRKVVRAWLCTNMAPQGSGDITGRREMAGGMEIRTIDITFTALTQYGYGVDELAQTVLDGISLTGADAQHRQAFIQSITADLAAIKAGYANNVATLAGTAVGLGKG